jgi:2-polyprenyl-3-methyl-5-hydroxy-6-metoxy-1,4-benzoquinol methylase
MSTPTVSADDLEAQVGAYAEQLFGIGLAAFEAATISVGRQTGLYAALAATGPADAGTVAAGAGVDVRYAQEWLEQQAAAGLIDTDGAVDAAARTFSLSEAAQACLLDPDSLASTGPLFDLLPAVGALLPSIVTAFRTGVGVPYADYAVHDAQGDFNRPAFVHLLATEWLPAIHGLRDRLSVPGARVAEFGSGEGWAAIAIARAFPTVRVDGFDLDAASVVAARKHAADAGVADRVHFEIADVTDASAVSTTGYDLVCAFEMIHDLAHPVEALANMRRIASAGATVLVVDENVGEQFAAPTENPVERLFYAVSVLHCLPVGRCEDHSEATGTVMRPQTLRGYADRAGFAGVEILPIEHDLFRFYRLVSA